MAKSKNITTMQLALMTAAAVISLRGLPMMAQEELTMFFYIFFATFLFLIPAALVGAELGSAFASRGGGVYSWVKEAFNPHMGFTAIFLQWIQNVVWYPTVLGFAAASIAYMIGMPALAQNGVFVGLFSIVMYWAATWVTLRGTATASGLTSKGFLIGTVLPGVVIVAMALAWIAGGNEIAFEHIPASVSQVVSADATQHAHPRLFPHITGMSDIAFLAGILLLFAGVEVHAVHAPELKEPQKQFPKAMFLAALISFGLFTLGLAGRSRHYAVRPDQPPSGLFTTFDIVFKHYRVGWLTNVMSLLIAFGVLAGVMSWISGPSRGLLWTAKEGQLPEFMKKTNKNGVQVNILVIQGCIVSVLSSLYIVMKDVSVAFFPTERPHHRALPDYVHDDVRRRHPPALYAARPARSYRVPGGNAGMWCIGGGGFLAVLFAFTVTFFPPSQLPVGSPALYTGLVVAGTVVFWPSRSSSASQWAAGRGKPAAVEIKNSGNAFRTVVPPSDASLPEGGTVIPDKPERCGQAAPQTAVSLPWLTRSSLPRVMDDPNLQHQGRPAPFIKNETILLFIKMIFIFRIVLF